MAVSTKFFGKSKEGKDITLYTITNAAGMQADVTDLGAILVNLFVPGKDGKKDDVVLGFATGEEYYDNASFFGATIGPSANRIGNAKFTIEGREYQLAVNDGPNNLHSDFEKGYHKRMWDAEILENGVRFSLEAPDGDMGFPGNLKISVTYTLTEDNAISLKYHGTTDRGGLLNMTNHSYFNLAGHKAGNIEDHVLTIHASCYTPVVPGAIPTGEIAPVAGTPMDFTKAKRIGDEIRADFEQLKLTKGYDHNWVVDGADGTLREIAVVSEPTTGRVMTVLTDLPGVQFYAGNCITPVAGKDGAQYEVRSGLCLETQCYPDSINKANFPSVVYTPEKAYDTETVYRFS